MDTDGENMDRKQSRIVPTQGSLFSNFEISYIYITFQSKNDEALFFVWLKKIIKGRGICAPKSSYMH